MSWGNTMKYALLSNYSSLRLLIAYIAYTAGMELFLSGASR